MVVVAAQNMFHLWLYTLILAMGLIVEPIHSQTTTPTPPSQDPFYVAPKGFEAKAPGSILRSRPIPHPLAFFSTIPANVKATYQLLYRSTDSNGKANAVVTTVMVPYNANTSRLLSYQTAEDSANVDCSPSYMLQQGTDPSETTIPLEFLIMAAALNQGWYVATPDYEGPRAAFTSGPQEAHGTLDGIRAVMNSGKITGVSKKPVTTMWGYSGGSFATQWAAELQPSYAPELEIAAAAIGGVPANVTAVFYQINNGGAAGLIPTGVMGLTRAFNDLSRFVDSSLVPSTAATFKSVLDGCAGQEVPKFADQNIFSYFKDGNQTLNDPIVQSVINKACIMGLHGHPKSPLYVYQAISDELCPIAATDALVQKYCKEGVSIQYYRDVIGEHSSEAIAGSFGALQYLVDVYNGVPQPQGCTTEEVALSRPDPDIVPLIGEELFQLLAEAFYAPIGPLFPGSFS